MGYQETYNIKPYGFITAKLSKLEENNGQKTRSLFTNYVITNGHD